MLISYEVAGFLTHQEVKKGENVSFLPSLSKAAKSFTAFIGVYIAR